MYKKTLEHIDSCEKAYDDTGLTINAICNWQVDSWMYVFLIAANAFSKNNVRFIYTSTTIIE